MTAEVNTKDLGEEVNSTLSLLLVNSAALINISHFKDSIGDRSELTIVIVKHLIKSRDNFEYSEVVNIFIRKQSEYFIYFIGSLQNLQSFQKEEHALVDGTLEQSIVQSKLVCRVEAWIFRAEEIIHNFFEVEGSAVKVEAKDIDQIQECFSGFVAGDLLIFIFVCMSPGVSNPVSPDMMRLFVGEEEEFLQKLDFLANRLFS
mmetsp:Transcript_13153/g.13741  ORF Transcript_13153/g.13741 Transcript_13153/m.13741 type:complete len:203 (-) Transcript_13153:264-872(-)